MYILPVALCSVVGVFFRAWRWQYFLRPLKQMPLERVWSATVIGYMGLNILPMRGWRICETLCDWNTGRDFKKQCTCYCGIGAHARSDLFNVFLCHRRPLYRSA